MVTLQDIAHESGLSRQAVARILNGGAKEVWPSMIERSDRVRRIAREKGYRPNAAARATVTGRFHTLALLLSTVHHRGNLSHLLLDGVYEACTEHAQHLSIARLSDQQLTNPNSIPMILRELNSDGLLIDYCTDMPVPMLDLLKEFQIPSIWINSKQAADCVHPDDFGAAWKATAALVEKGHEQIGYIDIGSHSHYSNTDRRLGYEAAMRAFGLSPRTFCEYVRDKESRRIDYCTEIFTRHFPMATAMLAYTNVVCLAIGAMRAGREPGRDLALITLSNESLYSYATLAARQPIPEYEMGRQAVAMLLEKIEAPDRKLSPVVVEALQTQKAIPSPSSMTLGETGFSNEDATARGLLTKQ